MFRIDSEHIVDATRTGGLARYSGISYSSVGHASIYVFCEITFQFICSGLISVINKELHHLDLLKHLIEVQKIEVLLFPIISQCTMKNSCLFDALIFPYQIYQPLLCSELCC